MVAGLPVPITIAITIGRTTQNNHKRSHIKGTFILGVFLSPATPYAFTEQGVAMLSSVMHSNRAIEVNIAIMRTFVVLQQNIFDYKGLKAKMDFLEKEMNLQFEDINQALNYLLEKDQDEQKSKKRKRIGFKTKKKK